MPTPDAPAPAGDLHAAWRELWTQANANAHTQPEMLRLLTARGAVLAAHYAGWRRRLARLRPGELRRLQRHLGLSLAGAALLLALLGAPQPAHAATIAVDGATCTLFDAIRAANTDTAAGGCPAGSGPDTLNITANISLTGSVPAITSAVTIEGNGRTISRASGTFGILQVWSGGDLTLNSATITGGSAYAGGGIYVDRGRVVVTNSTLSGNSAFTGGGIYARSATVTVTNSTLSGNSARIGGGIYAKDVSKVTVTNSTLSGNSAVGDGGGIWARYGTLAVSNSTLSGNTAGGAGGAGGGIRAYKGTVAVTNSTLSGNSATAYGGGIYARPSCTVALSRSLVSGNIAGTGNEVFNISSTITAANFNLFGHDGETEAQAFSGFAPGATDIAATSTDTSPATHAPTALGSILDTTLANNGAQPHPDTHALVSGSPAIDKATNASCTAAPTNNVDERGGVRNVDGNASASSNECDIGAFEYGSTLTPNAVGLREFAATSDASGPAGMLGAALAGLGGLGLSAFVARRSWRRRAAAPAPSATASPPAAFAASAPGYTPPPITQRSQLRQFSGSPLAVEPLNPLNAAE